MSHVFQAPRMGSTFNIGSGSTHVGRPARSGLSDLLRLMGVGSDAGLNCDDWPIATRNLRAGSALFHEGDEAEAIYFVDLGVFKCFRTGEDGYEQVLWFAGQGELLGYDALYLRRNPSAAVAIEDSNVYIVGMGDIHALSRQVPAFGQALHLAISRQLSWRSEVVDLMAAVAAEVRLARFLMGLSRRMQLLGQSPRRLLLRMCRRDIASHLGVAHETVSRAFGTLSDLGLVQVKNREVEILDLEALKAFCRTTRSAGEELVGATKAGMFAQNGCSANWQLAEMSLLMMSEAAAQAGAVRHSDIPAHA